MEDRQGRINELLDDLEPEHRDYVKQAVRDIVARSVVRARKDVEQREQAAA